MKTLKNCLAGAGVLLLGAGNLCATNYSWDTSATSGTWSTTTDWTPNSPTGGPTSADSIITPTLFGALNLIATQSVTNWTYSPTTAVNWTAKAGTGSSALNITNTLTVDDGGQSNASTEMIFEDLNATNTLTLSAGAINVNNGRLYIGGSSGTGSSIFSATVSGLTTIGGSTNNSTARLVVVLDGVSGNTANFAGGVAFGTGATSTSLADDFYFNASTQAASATAGFLSGGTKFAVVEGLSGAGVTSTLILNGNTGSNGDTGSNSFAGIIQDTAATTAATIVQKTGNDTQILTGANLYTGGTTISGGTLLASNTTGSGTGTGTVTVNNGGTLGGTGTVSGAVTVNNGAHLLGGAGSPVGMLTLSTAPTLNSGSVIELALGTGNTHSTLALPGGFNGFNSNQSFDLDGFQAGTYTDIITGVAAGINTSGWSVTDATSTYSFTDDGTGIDLSIAAVPEPSTWAGGVFCAGIAAITLRRRTA